MLFITALVFIVLTLIRMFSFWIDDFTNKELPMNKFTMSSYRFFSCFLETLWAVVIGIGAGLATGGTKIFLALAKYIFL